MCQTHAPQQMPLNTTGSQPPAGGGDPLSNAIQAEQAANPTTVSVNAPTKFGKLMNIVTPMLEGATIGGFEGKTHSGGGFGAAQDFYTAQRNHQLQQAMLQHTLTNDAFKNALEAARTQHEINRPNFTRVAFTSANGPNGPVLLHTNPDTGQPEEVQGYSPFDKNDGNVTPHMTDQGLVGVSKTGEASPITLPGAPQTVSTPTGKNNTVPGSRYSGAGASPSITKTVPGPAIPLGPPDKTYKSTLEDKAADAIKAKHPDWTDDQVLAQVRADTRKPDTSDQPLKGAKYNAARQKIQGNLDRDLKGSETTRTKDIKAAADDPDQIRQAEEDNADRKQQIHQKYADEADAMGIDLGQVPDYRSQLNGGTPQTVTPQPPKGGAAATAKVANTTDILAYAQKNNISSIEARKRFLAKGYTIKPVTGPK